METDDLILITGVIVMGMIALIYILLLFRSRRNAARNGKEILIENEKIMSTLRKDGLLVLEPPIIDHTKLVLFKNRLTGKFLGSCTSCVPNKTSVMNIDNRQTETYNQWNVLQNGDDNSFIFSNKEYKNRESVGYLSIDSTNGMVITDKDRGKALNIKFNAYDSQGYILTDVDGKFRLSASRTSSPNYDQYTDSGVVKIDNTKEKQLEDVWDMYYLIDKVLILQNKTQSEDQIDLQSFEKAIKNSSVTLRGSVNNGKLADEVIRSLRFIE